MAIQEGPSTNTEKGIRTEWPVVEGDTLGTTKIEGKQIGLVAEDTSNVFEKEKVGIYE